MKRKLVFLKTEEDFGKFRRSRQFYNPYLKVRIVRAADQNIPRFGFIVPKKVVPKVVDRNLIKRRLKSILQKHLEHFLPLDFLLFPQKTIVKIPFSVLESETLKLFDKARIWK